MRPGIVCEARVQECVNVMHSAQHQPCWALRFTNQWRTLFRGAYASLLPPSLCSSTFSDRSSSCNRDSSLISLGMTLTLQCTCAWGYKRIVKGQGRMFEV